MLVKILILLLIASLAIYRVRRARNLGLGAWQALGISIDFRSAVHILAGLLIAALVMASMFLVEWWGRLLSVDNVAEASTLLNDISTPIVVGFIEEFVFRAVLLGCLILWLGSRIIALALSAALFAAAHLANQNVNSLAILGYLLGGVIYGIGYLRTGRLWLSFGIHVGWNYTQGRVFGFPVGGGHVTDGLITQHGVGSSLWTGGDYGPEGGLIGIIARIAILLLTLAWLNSSYSHSSSVSDDIPAA